MIAMLAKVKPKIAKMIGVERLEQCMAIWIDEIECICMYMYMYVYISPPITLSSHFHQLSPVHTYMPASVRAHPSPLIPNLHPSQ